MLTDASHNQGPDDLVSNPRQVFTADNLATLNQRSNWKGFIGLLGHLGIMGISGYLWGTATLWIAIPALLVYGTSFALMFCTMHETGHRTAFANPRLNDSVAWLAGLLSFYNSTFYRRYHKWHHRYTQIPGKDPELGEPKPENWSDYLWHLSGLPWWFGKLKGHIQVASGQLKDCFFLAESAHAEVIQSTRLQLGLYLVIALITAILGHPWFLALYWLLPLAIGQPVLRYVLLAEHTGCTYDNNPLTNTRTTLTLWPLQFLMWNMPFHAEHHLYPSIPFHALPSVHQTLKAHFTQIEPGYLRVHRKITAAFGSFL
jgi:fatty acid desaturase